MVFVIFVTCIIVLLLLVISKSVSKNRIKQLKNNYAQISVSMTKQQVIEIMGKEYIPNMENGKEILVWHQQKNAAIERELLTKKSAEMTASVIFENGYVVEYSLS